MSEVSEHSHVDKAEAWDVMAKKNAEIAILRKALAGMLEHVRGEEFCLCEYKDNTEPADTGDAVDAAKAALATPDAVDPEET